MTEKEGTFTDLELVERVKQGEKSAYSQLVMRHQRSLLRLILRFVRDVDLAQDVVQEAFIKAYDRLESFEARASFKSWLFQIAVNTARNYLRDEKRDQFVNSDDLHFSIGPEAETRLLNESLSLSMRDLVDRLPERQRLAVNLRIYEDLSFKEIAVLMDCPYDTAKANFRHGLMKLKTQLPSWETFFATQDKAAELVEVEA
ncbi:MAG: sigma-70 family RNA polymerase sigma factor [Bdellovibrio sp.]